MKAQCHSFTGIHEAIKSPVGCGTSPCQWRRRTRSGPACYGRGGTEPKLAALAGWSLPHRPRRGVMGGSQHRTRGRQSRLLVAAIKLQLARNMVDHTVACSSPNSCFRGYPRAGLRRDLGAIVSFLDNRGSVTRSAQHLGVHRNTVQARLRPGWELGVRLDDPSRVFTIQIVHNGLASSRPLSATAPPTPSNKRGESSC